MRYLPETLWRGRRSVSTWGDDSMGSGGGTGSGFQLSLHLHPAVFLRQFSMFHVVSESFDRILDRKLPIMHTRDLLFLVIPGIRNSGSKLPLCFRSPTRSFELVTVFLCLVNEFCFTPLKS